MLSQKEAVTEARKVRLQRDNVEQRWGIALQWSKPSLLVNRLDSSGAAFRSGVAKGDAILEIDGVLLESLNSERHVSIFADVTLQNSLWVDMLVLPAVAPSGMKHFPAENEVSQVEEQTRYAEVSSLIDESIREAQRLCEVDRLDAARTVYTRTLEMAQDAVGPMHDALSVPSDASVLQVLGTAVCIVRCTIPGVSLGTVLGMRHSAGHGAQCGAVAGYGVQWLV